MNEHLKNLIAQFQHEEMEYFSNNPLAKLEAFIARSRAKYGKCRRTLFVWRKSTLN